MADFYQKQGYELPMTLKRHFEELRNQDGVSINELYSLYELLKKELEDKLVSSRSAFVTYSLHDMSHSRSIILAIERFLGKERIQALEPTDTFMLLICAYAHDYGMARSCEKIYNILGSKDFESFLRSLEKDLSGLEKEDAQAISNLLSYLNQKKTVIPLKDLYWSITLAVQAYLRSDHWEGIRELYHDFHGLFEGHLKGRFIQGSQGIVEICMCHGKDFQDLFQMEPVADGIVGDDFHPRFVAAMLRLGDLLDLDNGRFPLWFAREAVQEDSLLPRLSVLHYDKHESVSHLLIRDREISVRADCTSEKGGFDTADLIGQWTGWLRKECRNLRLHWKEIAPGEFGMPPGDPDIKIFVDGRPYISANQIMQMRMSPQRIMKLLEGSSIYRDKYVGIREVIQNAVDASLLMMWTNITQNVYLKYGLTKDAVKDGLDLMDMTEGGRYTIFADYDILVEVIKDLENDQVHIVVKDKGIGITLDDIKYIADIGSSKENNLRIRKIMEHMPDWMKPAGIFGIGLQSVFQLTDSIQFYTRQPNQPERLITLHSYGNSRGKIDVREVPANEDGMFYDNTSQGTNVKITIDPHRILKEAEGEFPKQRFLYYDREFDLGSDIDIAYAEICQVCKERIRSVQCDYFNIAYQELELAQGKKEVRSGRPTLRPSFFLPYTKNSSAKQESPHLSAGETMYPFITSKGNPYYFIHNTAYYWDKETNRSYRLKIRPCVIRENGRVILPDTTDSLYHVSYKFNKISNTETIYDSWQRARGTHAGFLEWNILIMDGDPTRYMNIDRERLKEGAISEQELLDTRKDILLNWCSYFCRQNRKPDGGPFKKEPGTLLSLILLFFQNVPETQFRAFLAPYEEYLDKMKLMVGTEQIKLADFWNPQELVETKLPPPIEPCKADPSEERPTAQAISLKTICHFPRRLVRIDSIYAEGEEVQYYRFRLDPTPELHTIQMSDTARLLDYIQAFDTYANDPTHIDFSTLQKKIFKPDRAYAELVIPRYPHTFCRGGNFSNYLDDCIRGFILSPFDRKSTSLLKRSIDTGNHLRHEELLRSVEESVQFEKCVQYIQRLRNGIYPNQQQVKQNIVKDYERFVIGLYECLFQNWKWIDEQLKRRGQEPSVM